MRRVGLEGKPPAIRTAAHAYPGHEYFLSLRRLPIKGAIRHLFLTS